MRIIKKSLTFELTDNVLTIFDSYKVHKREMRPILVGIRDEYGKETKVFNRSIFSLKMEWICHNFLYKIGYERERTKNVDLDYPSDRPEWVYILCGLLTWLFVW